MTEIFIKLKTFKEITKLERNGMFVYESVPGTAVNDFSVKDTEVSFKVEGNRGRPDHDPAGRRHGI